MRALKPIDFTNPETQKALTKLVKDAVRVEYGEVVDGRNMKHVFLNFGTDVFLTKTLDDLTSDDIREE